MLRKFFSVPSKRAVVRTTAIGVLSTVAAFNFTPVLTYLTQGSGAEGVTACDSFNNVVARDANKSILKHMSSMETTREVYAYASTTQQTVCTADVKSDGAEAQYRHISGRTLLPAFDMVINEKITPVHMPLVTLSHEYFHAIQAERAKKAVTMEEFSRKYDMHSNIVATLFSEAAAFAYETSVRHEYMQANPKHLSDIEFSMAQDLLMVFDQKFKETEGLDIATRRNLATRAVFEGFLTMEGPAILAREAYMAAITSAPWYMKPHRMFAFRRATVEDIRPLTELPNGFQLYRFDRLPAPSEITEMNALPLGKTAGARAGSPAP